jgi:hypothetical protein
MRFRLSTFLLAVLSIAILIGWLTDRSIQRNSEESIVDRETMAAAIFFRSQTALDVLNPEVAKGGNDYEIDLVSAVIELCENEKLYNVSSYSFSYDAVSQAGAILLRLKQDSKESFREFATTLYPFMPEAEQRDYRQKNNFVSTGLIFPSERLYPELYDSTSEEYKQLDEFLSRALQPDGK